MSTKVYRGHRRMARRIVEELVQVKATSKEEAIGKFKSGHPDVDVIEHDVIEEGEIVDVVDVELWS